MTMCSKTVAGAVGAGFLALGLATSAKADGYAAPTVAYERPMIWTGLYVGANAGWVDSSTTWVYHDPTGGFADRRLCGGLGCDITHKSGIYGGHLGYQYQFGALVLGLEASLSGPDNGFGSKPCFNVLVNCEARTDYLATIGPRLGFAFSNFMVYGTGGFAHGSILTRERVVATGVLNGLNTHGGNDGWFAGAGAEYAITRNVILGVEYLHVELDTTWNFSAAGGAAEHRNISADYDIVRARLSWKFNTDEVRRPLK